MNALAASRLNLKQTVQRFWYWWSGELLALVPARLKETTRERNRLDMFLEADGVTIEEVVDGVGRRLHEAHTLDALDADAWKEIEQFCAGRFPRLILASSDYLRIDLKLPRGASADLAEAVRLQLHLHSPLNPETIDWGVRKLGSANESVDAALIIARSSRIEAIQSVFAEHGLMPPIIAAPLNDVPLVLRRPLALAGDGTPTFVKRIYWLSAALLMLVPGITILGADIVTATIDAEATEIEARIAPKLAANRDAQRAEIMRRRLSPVAQAPSVVLVLEEVARLLPETMFLLSATALSERRLILVVDAPEGKDIAEPLLASPAFRDVSILDEAPSELGRAHYQIEIVLK